MKKMVTEINEGTYIDNDITLKELLQEWLQTHRKKLLGHTVLSTTSDIYSHIPEKAKVTQAKCRQSPSAFLHTYKKRALKKGFSL
ncbi:MAG: hypothetical protein ACOCRK_11290 [bacterium]